MLFLLFFQVYKKKCQLGSCSEEHTYEQVQGGGVIAVFYQFLQTF